MQFETALEQSGLFTPPSFVGSDYYCDSTTAAGEMYYGPWKSKLMFTSEDDICVGGELKDKAWWDAQGKWYKEPHHCDTKRRLTKSGLILATSLVMDLASLIASLNRICSLVLLAPLIVGLVPGEFRKELGFLTQEPLEIRVLHGHDTLYEGISLMSVKLEVCACPEKGWDGKPITRKECIDRCDNPKLKPPTDYTLVIIVSSVGVVVLIAVVFLAKGYFDKKKLLVQQESKIGERQRGRLVRVLYL